ncbi:pyridoxal reductase Plr1, partial [Pseudohyphozyma bogoriensis]
MSITASFPNKKIADVSVGPIAYGLMNFTWRPTQVPDSQAFEAMKAAIDAGATFFN